jgi:hypothetical protein
MVEGRSHMTSHYTRWFWKCVGTAFGHFLLGSNNFMVTALGSCVKWPLDSEWIWVYKEELTIGVVRVESPFDWVHRFGQTLSSPPTNYGGGGCQIHVGATLLGIFWNWPKTTARPAQLRKKYYPCILEGRLTTNHILSALHLQGLQSNIYLHFLSK